MTNPPPPPLPVPLPPELEGKGLVSSLIPMPIPIPCILEEDMPNPDVKESVLIMPPPPPAAAVVPEDVPKGDIIPAVPLVGFVPNGAEEPGAGVPPVAPLNPLLLLLGIPKGDTPAPAAPMLLDVYVEEGPGAIVMDVPKAVMDDIVADADGVEAKGAIARVLDIPKDVVGAADGVIFV